MNEEQNWSEISSDIANVAKKIKSRIDEEDLVEDLNCLLYTSPSPRDKRQSRMPSSA